MDIGVGFLMDIGNDIVASITTTVDLAERTDIVVAVGFVVGAVIDKGNRQWLSKSSSR
jgi:hypothetical protein